MALTLDQWKAKISKWVPSSFFIDNGVERKDISNAMFYAMAAVFQQVEQDMSDQYDATFILDSEAPILDLLGDERSVPRLPGQLDPSYAINVQNSLFLQVGRLELETVINNALFVGSVFLLENENYGFFDDADISDTQGIPYFDDHYTRWIDLTKWYNWWTAIFPDQNEAPDQFAVFANVIAAIENNKAYGTTYDLEFEPGYLLDEDGNYILTEDGNQIQLDP